MRQAFIARVDRSRPIVETGAVVLSRRSRWPVPQPRSTATLAGESGAIFKATAATASSKCMPTPASSNRARASTADGGSPAMLRLAILWLQQVQVTSPREVEAVSTLTDGDPLPPFERQLTAADSISERESRHSGLIVIAILATCFVC